MNLLQPICYITNSTIIEEPHCQAPTQPVVNEINKTIISSTASLGTPTSSITTATKIRYIMATISCASQALIQKVKPHLSSMTATGFLGAAAFGLCGKAITAFGEGKTKKGLLLLAGSATSAALCIINVKNFNENTQVI